MVVVADVVVVVVVVLLRLLLLLVIVAVAIIGSPSPFHCPPTAYERVRVNRSAAAVQFANVFWTGLLHKL